MDNMEIAAILIKSGKANSVFNSNPSRENDHRYREDLDLNKICIKNDAINCFKLVNNFEFKNDDHRFGEYYSLAKKNASGNILSMLEDKNEDLWDMSFTFLVENEPLKLDSEISDHATKRLRLSLD